MTACDATTGTSHSESIRVSLEPEALYDVVADVTRTGEWSPICASCEWDDAEQAGRVGATFTGHNVTPERSWTTRSHVVAAERGREFAWVVGDGFVRWSYLLTPVDGGTELTETWHFLPAGRAMFHDKFGEQADAEIASRTAQAHAGIPQTLAAIKAIVE
ncbi:SRPBCC family protein [Janibacter sp. Soil728]|uniref:SRPBCC family protein n=1 Tax=Janibacter sp. Soil728 TaxID=1736393 RepID=UPI0009EAE81B|nr:SRPBCC family protein [Janibacter sp. Soil728]